MFIDFKAVLAKVLIQIPLELLKSQGVTFFKRTVAFTVHLEALVGQVHVVVPVCCVVHTACSS